MKDEKAHGRMGAWAHGRKKAGQGAFWILVIGAWDLLGFWCLCFGALRAKPAERSLAMSRKIMAVLMAVTVSVLVCGAAQAGLIDHFLDGKLPGTVGDAAAVGFPAENYVGGFFGADIQSNRYSGFIRIVSSHGRR